FIRMGFNMIQSLAVTRAGRRRIFPRHLLPRTATPILIAVACLLTQTLFFTEAKADSATRPNIVLIMADDMGYSDVGCYGGEIPTPHIDALADGGLRFTQFYNTGRCCPTRASLLTGLYPHQAGLGHMVYGDKGPGYHPYLNDQCVTMAKVLREAGYRTMMTGKWHVGHRQGQWPTDRGFEHFYGIHIHVDSYFKVLRGCPVYHNETLVIPPTADPSNALHPDQEWYTTDVFTDWSLEYLDEAAKDDRPFFLYTAYNAPHWPLEAPDENIANFRGAFASGWDTLRAEKLRRMKEMGLISAATELPPSECPEWKTLSSDEKRESGFRREIYAAQIERMDQNIGRIVAKLRELNQLDNTLLLFLSDNGCCAEGGMFGYQWQKNGSSTFSDWRKQSGRSSSQGETWSNASNTPFRLHKRWVHEGGIATPLIAHWPQVITEGGGLTHQVGHVVDLMATCVDVAEANYPSEVGGQPIKPLAGQSLVASMRDRSKNLQRTLYWEHEKHSAIRVGNWKLVSLNATQDENWELYDMSLDRTETQNAASDHPDLVRRMRRQWTDWAAQSNVLPWPQNRVAN
ncbi:MAG: arylsulfatase, partial [Planctomycetota bacterium]